MNTYATISSSDSLYLFDGTPDAKYGVRTESGNKRIMHADGSITPTHHRNVKYYADVTGMGYADAFAACQAAHAAYQEQQRQWAIEREQREQERLAESYERREGVYSVEIPCNKMLPSGCEVRVSHYAEVHASSAVNAWVKAINTKPAHLYNEEMMERCHITFIGAAAE